MPYAANLEKLALVTTDEVIAAVQIRVLPLRRRDMPTEILMPALSPTMEEGTLAKWLVKEGDTVSSGDVIAEIETDKATMEFEAVDEGIVGKILVPEGTEGVKVNTPIAVLLEEGEERRRPRARPLGGARRPGACPRRSRAAAPPAPARPPPRRPALVGDGDAHLRLAAGAADRGGEGARPRADQGLRPAWPDREGRCGGAQPAARQTPRLPRPDWPRQRRAAAAPGRPRPGMRGEDLCRPREYEEVALDGMRKTIAARLTEAKQTIPHFYLRRDIRLDALLAFRAELNAQLAARGVKLSVNDFIIKACALALQEVPDATRSGPATGS
jgi:pyruvate dehydrogenase E2 component (dihydrolipoamide acetyltransferase)